MNDNKNQLESEVIEMHIETSLRNKIIELEREIDNLNSKYNEMVMFGCALATENQELKDKLKGLNESHT